MLLLVGLALGATVGALVAARYLETRRLEAKDLFAEKNRCQQLARRHEKDNTNIPYGSETILNVEYSRERSSCVAKIVREDSLSGLNIYLVADLLSGEQTLAGTCNSRKNECNDTLGADISRKQDALFTAFIHSKGRTP